MKYIYYRRADSYTTFRVLPSGAKTNKFFPVPTLEHATYSWPCEKQGVSRLIPATLSDWPWALLIDIAKAKRTGNWRRLNSNGISLGIMGIRGINTSSPFEQPVKIVDSITWGIRLFTQSLVPLQSLGASKFLRSIIGEPTLSIKLCDGIPGGSSELRNSVGYCTVFFQVAVVESVN